MKLFRRPFILISMVFAFSYAAAQEDSANNCPADACLLMHLIKTDVPIEYHIGLNGVLSLQRGNKDQKLFDVIFSNSWLLDEAGISKGKQEEVATRLESLKKELQAQGFGGIDRRTEKNENDEEAQEDDGEVRIPIALVVNFIEDLEEIIGRNSYDKLESFGIQSLMLFGGLQQLVTDGIFEKELQGFDFGTVMPKLHEKQNKQIREMAAFEFAESRKYFEEIVSAFPEESRDLIRSRWEKTLVRSGGLSQLHLQLGDEYLVFDQPDNIWDSMCSYPEFSVGAYCQAQFKPIDVQKVSDLNRLNLFRHSFMTPAFQNRLEIVGAQVLEYKEIVRDFDEVARKANAQVGMRHSCNMITVSKVIDGVSVPVDVYTLVSKEANEEYALMLEPYASPVFKRLKEVLLPHQKVALDEELDDMFSTVMGIKYDVVMGRLGRALKMNREEKQKFEKTANRIRDDIRNAAVNCAAKSADELFDVFPTEIATRMKKRYGSFPEGAFVDIGSASQILASKYGVDLVSKDVE
jgi:hypothetical protein